LRRKKRSRTRKNRSEEIAQKCKLKRISRQLSSWMRREMRETGRQAAGQGG
jgi:hypothetical protein